jgi:hypothetical protein
LAHCAPTLHRSRVIAVTSRRELDEVGKNYWFKPADTHGCDISRKPGRPRIFVESCT